MLTNHEEILTTEEINDTKIFNLINENPNLFESYHSGKMRYINKVRSEIETFEKTLKTPVKSTIQLVKLFLHHKTMHKNTHDYFKITN